MLFLVEKRKNPRRKRRSMGFGADSAHKRPESRTAGMFYPLVPDEMTMPSMMYCCAQKKMTSTGRIIMTVAAIR